MRQDALRYIFLWMLMNSDFNADEVNWAAVQTRWQLEAELQNPPPRRAISRASQVGCGARIGAPFLGCALLGIFVLGFFLSLWAGLAVLILPFGSTTTGVITAHELTRGRSPRYGNSESYLLYFEFRPRANAAQYSGEWPVNGATFTRLQDGDETSVRYFPFAPGLRPMLEAGISPWFHILLLGPLGLLLLVVGGLPLSGMLPQSRGGKRLVKRGLAAPGLIVKTEFGTFTSWFRVVNANGEMRTIESKQKVNANEQSKVEVGDVATVLFDARRPNRAAIYRVCGWRAR